MMPPRQDVRDALLLSTRGGVPTVGPTRIAAAPTSQRAVRGAAGREVEEKR